LAPKSRGLCPPEHQALGPREHFGRSEQVVYGRYSLEAEFAATRCRC